MCLVTFLCFPILLLLSLFSLNCFVSVQQLPLLLERRVRVCPGNKFQCGVKQMRKLAKELHKPSPTSPPLPGYIAWVEVTEGAEGREEGGT